MPRIDDPGKEVMEVMSSNRLYKKNIHGKQRRKPGISLLRRYVTHAVLSIYLVCASTCIRVPNINKVTCEELHRYRN